jgi:tyrosyl-tRNA synthetase
MTDNINGKLLKLEDSTIYQDKRTHLDLLLSIGEETTTSLELERKLAEDKIITVYDGFEPSGKIHIAQGLLRMINVNKFTSTGCKFKFWVADWFAQMNLKFGGDMKKIKAAGELMIETWKVCGMDMANVEFIWASEEILRRNGEYWALVLDISSKFSAGRIKKCTTIMGRAEDDDLSCSQLFYPVMQCADIFFLDIDICSLGMDQRKVNMLAREYCDKIDRKNKPIIISHHMLIGLDGSSKMSKSDPNNTIFMHDSKAAVNNKVKKAFCEVGNITKNPILEYFEYIIFPIVKSIVITRPEKYGGNMKYDYYASLVTDFKEQKIHPNDLKSCLSSYLNDILDPVRMHFNTNDKAKELLKLVESF